jgi:hypothetical protein
VLQAIIREVRATPLAALGAVAGLLSFVLSVLGILPPLPGASPEPAYASSSKPLALIHVALLVPALAFGLSYIATIIRKRATMTGLAATITLFVVATCLCGAFVGHSLSQFGVYRIAFHEYVLDIHLSALSFALMLVILLIFAGPVCEEILRDWRVEYPEYQRLKTARKTARTEKAILTASRDMELLDSKWNYWKTFWSLALIACSIFGWLTTHVTLRATVF